GGYPGDPAIPADFHRLDGSLAGPRAAFQEYRAGRHDARTSHEVREAGRHEQSARSDAGDGTEVFAGRSPEAVGGRLLEALEGRGDRGDPGEPLDVGHAVPPGRDEAQREPVLRW